MEGSQSQGTSGSNSPAPFLTKTYEMVDDSVTNCVVSWSQSGCSFVVWDPPRFCSELLPKYFKHNNFSSFIRQLNTYGFRKIDPEQWEFANENFIRRQRHLLKEIYRRKPIHSHSQQLAPLSETERQEYEEKIKRLSHEKLQLQIKLETEMQSLRERLQNMEERQRQLIAQVLPAGFDENNKRRRRTLLDEELLVFKIEEEDDEDDDRTVQREIEKIEASLKTMESFVHETICYQDFDEENIQLYSPRSGDDEEPSPDFTIRPPQSPPPLSNNSNKIDDEAFEKVKNRNQQVNDVFWSHFLSENYTLHVTDEEERQKEVSDHKTLRCNSYEYDHVDNITKHLRHLTPAE